MHYKHSEVLKYPIVTTVSALGGIGVGRLIEGKVYASGGNGYYYEKEVVEYKEDNGDGYLKKVREVYGKK